jgi:hypothetical protein
MVLTLLRLLNHGDGDDGGGGLGVMWCLVALALTLLGRVCWWDGAMRGKKGQKDDPPYIRLIISNPSHSACLHPFAHLPTLPSHPSPFSLVCQREIIPCTLQQDPY